METQVVKSLFRFIPHLYLVLFSIPSSCNCKFIFTWYTFTWGFLLHSRTIGHISFSLSFMMNKHFSIRAKSLVNCGVVTHTAMFQIYISVLMSMPTVAQNRHLERMNQSRVSLCFQGCVPMLFLTHPLVTSFLLFLLHWSALAALRDSPKLLINKKINNTTRRAVIRK